MGATAITAIALALLFDNHMKTALYRNFTQPQILISKKLSLLTGKLVYVQFRQGSQM